MWDGSGFRWIELDKRENDTANEALDMKSFSGPNETALDIAGQSENNPPLSAMCSLQALAVVPDRSLGYSSFRQGLARSQGRARSGRG